MPDAIVTPSETTDTQVDFVAPASGVAQDAGEARLVPVTEAIRYRKRAQTAEQQLGEMHKRVQTMESDLAQARESLQAIQQRQELDALLTGAQAIDLEAGRVLAEDLLARREVADGRAALAQLRRQKPWLFRRQTRQAEAMGMPARSTEDAATPSAQAAQQAFASGQRRDLMQYLRLRRSR